MRTIICLPGLGGRANLFNNYKKILSDFDLKFVDIINWPEAQKTVDDLVGKQEQVIFFCNCYGFQFALRTIEKYPFKVSAIIVIEPFFGELVRLKKPSLLLNRIILFFLRGTDKLGLKRTKFPEIDYSWIEKQPLYFQPFHDMRHQNMTEYFEKIEDILTFKIPKQIKVKTLFIFSPGGYVTDKKEREFLKRIFINSDAIELGKNTHNIMTLSSGEIGEVIKKWLNTQS